MKRIFFLIAISLLCAGYVQAQEIGRLSLGVTEPNKENAAEIRAKNIAEFNARVDSIKNMTNAEFTKLQGYVDGLAATDTFFNKVAEKVRGFVLSGSPDSLKIATGTAEVRSTVTQPVAKTANTVCTAIAALKDLKIEKSNDAEYTCTLTDTADNPLKSFKLTQFNEKLFNDKFRTAIYGLCNGKALSKTDSATIESFYSKALQSQNLYQRMLEASLEVNDDEVLAGILRVNKVIPVTIKNYNIDTTDKKNKAVEKNTAGNKPVTIFKQGKLIIHDIQIQFQDGFIENIKVLGHLEGKSAELKFENAYPISFTTRKDYRRFQDLSIYERTIYATHRDNDSSCKFKLGNLLFYNQNLQLNTKDYSPANQVLQQKITDSLTYINLNKELTSKILEMKVFSDLKGVEGGEPNGLVQFEVSKRLNFFTSRWPVPYKKAKVNIGLFNYFTPMFTMNKIENNSKRLTPYYLGTSYPDTNKANAFASTLDLFQRQVFTVGGNLTVLTVDIPGLKSTANFGTGFSWGRVLIEDTLRAKVDSSHFTAIKDNNINQFGVNSIQFAPEVSWQIFPDKRYGVTFSQRLVYYRLQSSALKQVKDSSDYQSYIKGLNGNRNKINDYRYQKWLGTTEIYAFYAPSEYNKVFFRYRFNWDLGNIKNNFHQLQIGVSTYLTHTKKKEEK
jgi:hypothetical protein